MEQFLIFFNDTVQSLKMRRRQRKTEFALTPPISTATDQAVHPQCFSGFSSRQQLTHDQLQMSGAPLDLTGGAM
jgi:ribosomal protein L32